MLGLKPAMHLRRSAPRVWRVGQEFREIVARGVVEGKTGDLPQLRVAVLDLLASKLGLPGREPSPWCLTRRSRDDAGR
jgi:hypothetical protein